MELINGILVGLLLSILLGPLLFSLIQVGIEEGFRAGLSLALGIWISDFLFVFISFRSIRYISQIAETVQFRYILGIGGAIVLFIVGFMSLKKEIKSLPVKNNNPTGKSYLKHGITGFLINSLNPFTVFFWISVLGAYTLNTVHTQLEVYTFTAGILGTIMITDTLKVIMAKKIRGRLSLKNINWVRKISGASLIVFGVVLLVRVLIT